ncbi:hypothetical protein N1030_04495 [Desulfovibrio mangrovi]|uniref:hypothetical protein n=1 Tax=Desulfovibrio mangrovi TaxID=2976983 RepID=UPI0022471F45|nr:hypothetical protein [Desulfovibrio mangrovi]UZP68244.1 hypothetical protein N1030_04495 [Desulfovibrio mangrovi]
MVPCFICGKDATGGFIHGFVPAPDSQKVGLCAVHNTLENKKQAILHWILTMKADMVSQNEQNARRIKAPLTYKLTIRYADGGVATIPCLSWEVTEQSTLQITRTDKALSFIPLLHIRQFDVSEEQTPAAS